MWPTAMMKTSKWQSLLFTYWNSTLWLLLWNHLWKITVTATLCHHYSFLLENISILSCSMSTPGDMGCAEGHNYVCAFHSRSQNSWQTIYRNKIIIITIANIIIVLASGKVKLFNLIIKYISALCIDNDAGRLWACGTGSYTHAIILCHSKHTTKYLVNRFYERKFYSAGIEITRC